VKPEIREKIRQHVARIRSTTDRHFDGCEAVHARCALVALHDELLYVERELEQQKLVRHNYFLEAEALRKERATRLGLKP
jgi:hypothetical protein